MILGNYSIGDHILINSHSMIILLQIDLSHKTIHIYQNVFSAISKTKNVV